MVVEYSTCLPLRKTLLSSVPGHIGKKKCKSLFCDFSVKGLNWMLHTPDIFWTYENSIFRILKYGTFKHFIQAYNLFITRFIIFWVLGTHHTMGAWGPFLQDHSWQCLIDHLGAGNWTHVGHMLGKHLYPCTTSLVPHWLLFIAMSLFNAVLIWHTLFTV